MNAAEYFDHWAKVWRDLQLAVAMLHDEHLGFRPEALLADHAMSRDGHTHDLLLMSYDVAGFSNDAPVRPAKR